jgi:hypothetical protein
MHGRGLSAAQKKYIEIAILAIIIANAAAFAFTHAEGASQYGDDPNYIYLASATIHGQYRLIPGYIFTARPMSFLPIALMYELFGISVISSTLWNIISYLGAILVAYLAVKLFYSEKAALISALLVSIYPLLTKYALNTGEDISLMFISSIAVLLFLYAERSNNRWQYLASGALLVIAWEISYEGGVAILFLLSYAIIELLRKKITISKTTLFFIEGIALAFLVTFALSYLISGTPFFIITDNLNFYSAVGTTVNGISTIPTTNTNLSFYINGMYQYGIVSALIRNPTIAGLESIWATIFNPINTSSYGLYFYLLTPIIILLLLFDRRSYFFIYWFAFIWLFLEFGPMHVGISLAHPGITYLLAYRLHRFMMLLSIPLCAIIGIGLSKLITPKKMRLLVPGAIALALIIMLLYANNYQISNFWYEWQHFPESISLQVSNFIRPYVLDNATVYIEAISPNGGVSFYGAYIPTEDGYPSDPRVVSIYANQNCTYYPNGVYVVWSGKPPCSDFIDVFNVSPVTGIPSYVIQGEIGDQTFIPTNVYHVVQGA